MDKNMSHRGTIFQETTRILQHDHLAGEQHILRLHAPQIAEKAQPGSFVHIDCGENFQLRRPISIMLADASQGTIDLLYKQVGAGTAALAEKQKDKTLDLLGPIGNPFVLHPERPRPLLIGGGVGMPPMVFIAQSIHNQKDQNQKEFSPFVILGSEVPFPFSVTPSKLVVPGVPAQVAGMMPLLEDWGVPNRLASLQGYAGTFEGYVTDLARHWLDALDDDIRNEVEIFSCGPHPMLEAVAKLAKEHELPCQVSLEEFMACGVGGCAGCVVEVKTPEGKAMKRVCVDGPVFDAEAVF